MVTKKTRLVSGLAAVVMLISMFAAFVIPVSAENVWNEQIAALKDVASLPDIKDYSSAVTEYTEYKVTDPEGMEKLSALVIGGNDLSGITIYQANDIDMAWAPFVGIGGYIYRISGSYSDCVFSGTFDGNGYVIENLYVLRNNDLANSVGLFGYTDGATLRNIGIASGLVVGSKKVGALVGKSVNTSIVNCWNAATVVGGSTEGTGGLVGYAEGDNTLLANCYNLGLVFNREKNASGIVGYVAEAPNATIVNCYNAGTIVTGLAGYGDADSSKGLEAYAVIMGADYTTATASKNVNNYYIAGTGKVKSVAELSAETKGLLGDGYTEIAATDAATLTTLDKMADQLNNGNVALGNGSDSDYSVSYVTGNAGYPVLAYKKNGSVVVKRVAHTAENVACNTWANESTLFKKLTDVSQSGGWGASDKLSNLEISTANDLFIFGLISSFGSNLYKASYGNGSVTLTADIDMNALTLCKGLKYYVPIASGSGKTGGFDGTFDGANHVIKNWKYFAAQVGGNVDGGLISVVNGGAVVKDLGMIDAYGDYNYRYAEGGYSYPGLLVERDYGDLTMDNCFVTGTLDVESSAANANNNGGVLSTTFANAKVTNCWADVKVIDPATADTAEPTKARVIGKIPAANAATSPSENNYFIADAKPYIIEGNDNGALHVQTMIGTEYSTANGTMAAYLNDVMKQRWACKNGVTTFAADASEATFLLKVVLKMGDYVYDIRPYAYNYNAAVTTPAFSGFELDTAYTYPKGTGNGSFTMPNETVTLYYKATKPDYEILKDLIAEYEQIDPDYLADGEGLQKVLDLASDILAAVAKGNVSDADGIKYISQVMTQYAALDTSMKTEYPNYPEMKDYDIYKDINTAKSWLITDPEDWRSLVANADGYNFSGHSFHFTNNIDMNNVAVAPVAADNNPAFRGKIYGHGYVIKNLLIDWDISKGEFVGLIGSAASGCAIYDLGIESGLVRAYGTSTGEALVASFVGQGISTVLQHCWNAATVDSVSANASVGQSVSGIGRFCDNSYVDGCFNVGAVRGGSGSYVGSLSGYTQSVTAVWNSFAVGTATGSYPSFVRYTGTVDTLTRVVNAYTVGNTGRYDYGNSEYNKDNNSGNGKYNTSKYELGYDAYQTGELAWLLNANSEEHKIYNSTPTYYTVKNGKTVFGTVENQTRKISYLLNDVEIGADYVSANTDYTLDYVDGATYTLAGGTATLNGNKLSMGQDDVKVNVNVNNKLDYTDLLKAMSRYDSETLSYMKDSAAIKAKIADAKAKIANGTYADQAAVKAAAEALNASYVYAGYPTLPSITKSDIYPDAPGYIVSSLEELEYLSIVRGTLTVDDVIYLGADIEVTSRASAANVMRDLKASIDGKGHTIKGITIASDPTETGTGRPDSWLGNYTGNYIKNLTMDNWTVIAGNWQSSLLIGKAQNANMVLENINVVNCSVQSSTASNGAAFLVGIQEKIDYKLTFRNISIENCTLDRAGRANNSGFLIGRAQKGEVTVENIYLNNNKTLGSSSEISSTGVLIGEVTTNVNINNVGVFNTTTEENTFDNGVLIGNFKQGGSAELPNPTLTVKNVIAVNNGDIDCLIYRQYTTDSTVDASNLYADIAASNSGVTGTHIDNDVLTLADTAYEVNKDVSAKWAVVGSGLVLAAEGQKAPVKVELVDTDGVSVAVLYTDAEGKLIGLTNELYQLDDWGYESYADMQNKVFIVDTVINATPCEHLWYIVPNRDGQTHKKVCVNGCGRIEIIECEFTYTYNETGETHTHTKKCAECGYLDETENCTDKWNVFEATCTQNRILKYGCALCDHYDETKTIVVSGTKLDHKWTYTKVNGKIHIATCEDCGTIETQDCELTEEYVAHTTSTKGYTLHTCEDCGYSYKVEDANFEHEWDEENYTEVVKYPTYTEAGSMKVKCKTKGCDAHGYVEIPTLEGLGVQVNAPVRADADDTFDVTLALANNNNNVAGLTVKLTYDTSILTLGTLSDDDVQSYYNADDGVVYLSFANKENYVGNVTLATIPFTVNSEAETGETTITATVEKSPTSGENASDTGAADENGNFVTVGGSSVIVTVAPYLWGDANSNDITNIEDAILVLRYAADFTNDLNKDAANVTKLTYEDNSDVNAADAILILRYAVGLFDPKNPPQNP